MAKLLLVEDNENIRQEYRDSLIKAGFEVVCIDDGCFIEDFLIKEKFDVVLCDSEMRDLDGPEACKRAREKNILDDNVLLIGMSDNSNNQKYWRGLAHFAGFYNKDSGDIGQKVMAHYKNFEKLTSPIWRQRMPELK